MLSGKVIVITGGAGLLGRQFCASVAEQNALAVVADLDLELATQAANQIITEGRKAEAARLDITNPISVENLIADLDERHGRIDALVNNAYPRNSGYGAKFEDVSYADFCENTTMHLGGYFLVAQRFSKYFKNRGHGNIINMASIYGVIAPRFNVYRGTNVTMPIEYAVIKSGIIHLTRYIAQYHKSAGIRCNALSPGGILDGQPGEFLSSYKSYCGLKGMLEPGDICGALLFLLSDHSRFITGQNIVIDDGYSL